MRAKWVRWIPVLLWCMLIFLLTASPVATSTYTESAIRNTMSMPAAQARTINSILRKQAHVLEFAVLALLTRWAMGNGAKGDLGAWLFTTLYAGSDEWHQVYVPGRTGSIKDVLLDALGAVAALAICRLVVHLDTVIKSGSKGAPR